MIRCYVSALDPHGRTIWIADAHRDDGKRFVVHAEELLTAFMELRSAKEEKPAQKRAKFFTVGFYDLKRNLPLGCALRGQ
jgi:hypothetical protein